MYKPLMGPAVNLYDSEMWLFRKSKKLDYRSIWGRIFLGESLEPIKKCCLNSGEMEKKRHDQFHWYGQSMAKTRIINNDGCWTPGKKAVILEY